MAEAKANKRQCTQKKFCKEIIDAIVKDIAEGSHHKFACEANGVTEKMFYVWLEQGRLDIQEEIDSLNVYLVQSLSKVKMHDVKELQGMIRREEKGHRGAEWTLEHAYWRQYGQSAANIEMEERLNRMEEKFGAKNADAKQVDPKSDS